jgi:VWFA-related protein
MRPFIIFIFFCVASATALAQQPAVFQSETRIVLVDAVVTDRKGEHLRDLNAKDFRVWEDNREQAIRSFSVALDPSPAEPRRLVLFFDDAGLSAADQVAVRQAAAGFIDSNAGPGAMMAVVNYDGGFRVAQSFTADGGRLKEAVRGVAFSNSKPLDGGTSVADRAQASASLNFNVRGLTEAVGNLARNLNAVPGRKIVVLFTTGASFSGVQESDIADLVEICNRSNVALYPVSLQAVGALSGNGLDCGQRQATRFPVQQQDAAGCGVLDNNAVPSALGSGTGGFLVHSNDVLAHLQQIGAEQKQYYVVGYVPPDSKEGVCHKLRVKVERSGAVVRARSGYCTAKPQDLLAKSRVEQDLEKHAGNAQAGTGSTAAIEAPFFYTSSNVARVHVAMEIATDALQFENQKGKLHAEMNILGIASAADGTVAARFSDIVRRSFNTRQELDQWKQTPLHYEKEFRVVSGQYGLTVVFSSGGANFGKVETPLTVDPYERGQLAISGVALSKEVKPAADLGLEASLIDEGTPLVAGIMQVIPTGSNAFSASAPAFCYFEVYTPGATESATVGLRILDAQTGAQKWDGGSAKLNPSTLGKFTIPVGLGVPISSLAAGSYRLEITATNDAGKTARRTLDFMIR